MFQKTQFYFLYAFNLSTICLLMNTLIHVKSFINKNYGNNSFIVSVPIISWRQRKYGLLTNDKNVAVVIVWKFEIISLLSFHLVLTLIHWTFSFYNAAKL